MYEQQRGLKVVACSASASEKGILPGMPVAEATALAVVHLEPSDLRADRAALEQLAQWCEQFGPIVGLEEAERPESLFLDATALAPLFGSEQALIEQVARAFTRRGLTVQVGLADTWGAAWAVAHYGGSLSIVPPGETRAALEGLPMEALRLSAKTAAVLGELGVEQVGQLLALPRSGLAARFEPQLIDRLDQALGLLPEALAAHRPPPVFVAERQLQYPIDSKEAIEFVLTGLIQRIAEALAARQQGAIQLECRLDCPPAEPLRFLVGLFEASASPGHLLELIETRLERLTLPGPLAGAQLMVLVAAPLQSRQRELFGDSHNTQRQLALLVDRLSSRLTREAVVCARLVPDAQPEYAYRYEPLAGTKRQPMKQPRKLPPRPVLMESGCHGTAGQASGGTLPLEVLALAPAGVPAQFCFRGQQYRVTRSWGPERIQTGWWRGNYIRRDYYRVQTDTGRSFWLFRAQGRWFLQGVFD